MTTNTTPIPSTSSAIRSTPLQQTLPQNVQPKLTVLGAGPGDPELISLKAVKALQQADVVLYDALVNTSILQHCKPSARTMYVGKQGGISSISQDDLNKCIVRNALLYGHVVRLKGGDPFVFGRGFEEMCYAEEWGVPAEYIPGISSAICVPGLEHIPLTHRGISEGFWVITGSLARAASGNGNASEIAYSQELHIAAQTDATVVVLMGIGSLPAIMSVFARYGKSHLPVAVIHNGSLPESRIVTGTVKDIISRVHDSGIHSPATVVIGKVVHLRSHLQAIRASEVKEVWNE